MSEQAYNDQIITQYLLGALPEEEAERLDELSFTDDEFADALKTAEKDLVDAYAQGELTGATLERFRTYYLASPLRREKAEFAKAFQALAEREAASEGRAEARGKPATKGKGSGWFSALSAFAAPRAALQWGAALAALLLLVAGGWLALENARLRRQVSQTQARRDALDARERELQKALEDERSAGSEASRELARVREERERLEGELTRQAEQAGRGAAGRQPAPKGALAVASFVLTPQMRGAGDLRTVSVPADTAQVAMRLELEPDDHPAYRVALLEQAGGRTLWQSGRLRARAAGGVKSVGVSFPARLLRSQAYVLRVTGVGTSGASETVGEYPFRVVK